MKRLMLIVGLLCLTGCESTQYVEVELKGERERMERCHRPIESKKEPVMVTCTAESDGRYYECPQPLTTGTGYVCPVFGYQPDRMSVEEFQFRYNNDKAFREAIESYTFH